MGYSACDVCYKVDDHPKHAFAGVIEDRWPAPEPEAQAAMEESLAALVDSGKVTMGEALTIGRNFGDTTSIDRHMDCCAQVGCPLSGTIHDCALRAEKANGGTGKKMVDAAMAVREERAKEYAALEGSDA